MLGTLINAGTVIVGGLLGLAIGEELKKKVNEKFVFDVVGVFTVLLGVSMGLKMEHPVSLILGSLLGTLIGEAAKLQEKIERGSELVKKKVGGGSTFSEGLLTAFITFCVGPMTVVGSILDGVGEHSIIITKAIMDGFVAIAYAAAMGMGVVFSALPLLLFQGSLAVLGALMGNVIPAMFLNDLTASGGLILLALGITLLNIKRIKVANMLPSLVFVPVLSYVLSM